MSKLIATVVLGAMLLAIVLTGCSSDPAPTATPTATPTAAPTAPPTATPTATPTAVPTATPTLQDQLLQELVADRATATALTPTPTAAPTATPTAAPTAPPTAAPAATPTAAPTAPPTAAPAATPTAVPPTPAPTATNREDISLTFACAREASRSCEGMEEFVDAVRTRTGGQVEIELSSYAEEGLPENPVVLLAQLRVGRAEFAELHQGQDIFHYPNAVSLWEAFAMPEEYAEVSDALAAGMIRLVGTSAEEIDLKVVGINLHSDAHLFSKQPVSRPADLEGLRTRLQPVSRLKIVSDLLTNRGAGIHLLPLGQALTELASGGVLDAAVTCGSCAVNAKLHEVTTHVTGPFPGVRHQSFLTFARWAWEELPEDVRTIIEEEGRAHTQREIARAGERDAAGLQELIDEGMSYAELPPEVRDELRNMIARLAGVDEEMARALGLTLLPDGTVVH